MMKLLRGTSLTVFALSLMASAHAQDRYLGPDVGVFFPNDTTLRNALGDNWISFGVSSMRDGVQQSRAMGTNWNIITQSKNGNKVFMGSYSYGIVMPLGLSETRPYVAARGGLSYIDYALGPVNNRISGKQIGYNINLEAGLRFGDRVTLAARYDFFSKHDGLSFDGLSLSLSYALVKF